jgi:mercuric ion transport protein
MKYTSTVASGMGALFSALLASVCCLGPFVLVGIGLGGLGLAATFAPFRPVLLVLTGIFLVLAFYFAYRKREVVCEDGRCELRASGPAYKAFLWLLAIVVALMATFPFYAHRLVGSTPQGEGPSAFGFGPGHHTWTLGVNGMTCHSCSRQVDQALEALPGVRASRTDYTAALTVLTVDPSLADSSAVLTAIRELGYEPKFSRKGLERTAP